MKEYTTVTIKPKRAKTMYLSLSEKREIIKDLNETALVLYEYFIGSSKSPAFNPSDKAICYALGWKITKARDTRLLIQKNNYLKIEKYKNGNKKLYRVYLGKENVLNAK